IFYHFLSWRNYYFHLGYFPSTLFYATFFLIIRHAINPNIIQYSTEEIIIAIVPESCSVIVPVTAIIQKSFKKLIKIVPNKFLYTKYITPKSIHIAAAAITLLIV